ncbi:hypothetical protein ACFOU2_15725 [Bacillus songklensis]|uniref:Uncharacterized protein n=1 Tax=Bacillus songklensis TaxID=1069116 RepID=A0ABV8B645_9BACI
MTRCMDHSSGKIHTAMANEVPVKVAFVQNCNKNSEWLAILSTDYTLSEQEIVRSANNWRDVP